MSPHGELDPITRAELAHQAGQMGLDGAGTDVEIGGDLTVGSALRHGEEHLLLTGGERFHRLCGWSLLRPGKRRKEADGDAGSDQSITVGCSVDRLGE